jgi:hypothetical protein
MQHVFQLAAVTEASCSHVNIREENHGDDKVLAVDLAFWMEGSNDILDLFHPELRQGIYCNRAADAGQEDMPDTIKVLPNLRVIGLPERMRFGGDDKFSGYRMVLDYGLGDALANVDLTDCVIAKKWIEPKEGGTCKIGWRVSYAGEALQDVMTRGKLAGLKGQKAFIVLNPPPTITLVKPAKKGKAKTEPEKNAGDIFSEQHGGGEPGAAAGGA